AARLGGDRAAATRHLARARQVGWSPEQIEIETLLVRAETGDFRAVEGPLRALDRPGNPDRDLARAVLVPNYITEYQLAAAYEVLQPWVEAEPENVRARLWMYDVARRLEVPQLALESARAAAALAPDDEEARLRAGQILADQHQAAEALPHFDWLADRRPADPEVLLGMARCHKLLGDSAAAARALDDLLGRDPNHPLALAERGYVEQQAGRPADALPWLRKAAALVPGDPDVVYNLAVCLGQTGHADEAAVWRGRHERAAADLREMTEVTKAVAKDPRNPDLRYKAGVLMIRNGHEREGLRWLQSALAVDPAHRPTREALAERAKAAGPK
ncbi:MAG: tetratricopeptide repeat protein, partial [Gemmataceae bacterium]|nr:tetratricopeptide repeat protein [Gemmataceae bacterium]